MGIKYFVKSLTGGFLDESTMCRFLYTASFLTGPDQEKMFFGSDKEGEKEK